MLYRIIEFEIQFLITHPSHGLGKKTDIEDCRHFSSIYVSVGVKNV